MSHEHTHKHIWSYLPLNNRVYKEQKKPYFFLINNIKENKSCLFSDLSPQNRNGTICLISGQLDILPCIKNDFIWSQGKETYSVTGRQQWPSLLVEIIASLSHTRSVCLMPCSALCVFSPFISYISSFSRIRISGNPFLSVFGLLLMGDPVEAGEGLGAYLSAVSPLSSLLSISGSLQLLFLIFHLCYPLLGVFLAF